MARVLIIDDEPGLARALARRLCSCNVTACSSARDALQMLAELPPFDLIICDVHLDNGVDGRELRELVLTGDAEKANRWVFITGDDPREVESGVPVLGKPFTAAAVNELLRAAARPRCDVCECSTFNVVDYGQPGGMHCPALECTGCRAIKLDESAASSDAERDAVNTLAAARCHSRSHFVN